MFLRVLSGTIQMVEIDKAMKKIDRSDTCEMAVRRIKEKMDLCLQISRFPGFSKFPVVAQVEQPLETETNDY